MADPLDTDPETQGLDEQDEGAAAPHTPDLDPENTDSSKEEGDENPLESLQAEIARLKAQVDSQREAYKQFSEVQSKAYEREKADYERQISALRTQRKEALASGDGDSFDEADEALRNLLPPEPPRAKAPEVDPEVMTWLDSNKWYNTNGEARTFMDSMAQAVRSSNPNLSGQALLDKAKERVMKAFPEIAPGRRTAPRGATSPSTNSTGATPRATGRLTLDSLSAGEQETVRTMVRMGLAKTPEEYLERVAKANAGAKK